MVQNNIDGFIALVYTLLFFMVFGLIGVFTMLVVSFVAYIKTGVHVRDWLEEKFPRD